MILGRYIRRYLTFLSTYKLKKEVKDAYLDFKEPVFRSFIKVRRVNKEVFFQFKNQCKSWQIDFSLDFSEINSLKYDKFSKNLFNYLHSLSQICLFSLFIIGILFILSHFIGIFNFSWYYALTFIIFIPIIGFVNNRFESHAEMFMTSFLAIGLLVYINYYRSRIDSFNPKEAVLIGSTLGASYAIAHNVFVSLNHIIILHIQLLIFKVLYFGQEYPVELILSLIFDMILISSRIKRENSERKLFEGFYFTKKDLTEFKNMVDQSLSLGMVVLNLNQSPIFINKSFKQVFKDLYQSDIRFGLSEIGIIEDRFNSSTSSSNIKDDFASNQLTTIINNKDEVPHQFPDKIEKNLSTQLRELADSKIKRSYFAIAFVVLNDEKLLYEINATKITYDGDEVIVLFFNDITDRQNVLSLRLANKNKNKVLATVSHELRTPLNIMLGIFKHIKQKSMSTKSLYKNIDLCMKNAKLLLGLVNSILDINQIQVGKLKLRQTHFSVREFLEELKSIFEYQCEQKNISLSVTVSDEDPDVIYSDRDRLTQILINLIGNACKFTTVGGIDIGFSVENEKGSTQGTFWVSDTGVGIKEQDLNKLFVMYGKLEETDSVNQRGVGLGLTICNALVQTFCKEEKMNVKSQFGKGTTFYFSIPIIKEHLSEEDLGGSHSHHCDITEKSEEFKRDFIQENILDVSNQSNQQLLSRQFSRLPSYMGSSFQVNLLERKSTRQEVHEKRFVPYIYVQSAKKDLSFKISAPNSERTPPISPKKTVRIHEQILQSDFYENQSQDSSGLQIAMNSPENQKDEIIDRPKVLLVDDNAFNLMVGKSFIEKYGFTVISVMSGAQAIDILQQAYVRNEKPFKFILMDLQMPIMDGYETTSLIKSKINEGLIPKTPILAHSANNSADDIARAIQSGMITYLSKPLDDRTFMNAIRKFQLFNELQQ